MRRLVALTGAGISKASGIPTFVEMGNLREKLSRDYFISNKEEFYKTLIMMKNKIDNSKPNDAHIALAQYNVPIITMNIDGLHKKAGSKKVIEIHGNFEFVRCNKCNKRFDFKIVETSINCPVCSNLLEPNIVLYGDMIPSFFNAVEILAESDSLLVVGTSFYTSTSTQLVNMAKRKGIKVDIINDNAEIKVRKFLEKFFY